VHEATLQNEERTESLTTSAKGGTTHLPVWSATHPSLWTPLDALQMDEATAATDIVNDAYRQPPTKRVKRTTGDHQRRLHQLCVDRCDGKKIRRRSSARTETLHLFERCVTLDKHSEYC